MINLDALPWINVNHDSDAIQLAAPFLPEAPIILEAGTLDAEDTCRFKARWPDCIVYGFEPNPAYYLRSIKETSNLSGVTITNKALSHHNGSQIFYVSKENPGASSLLSDNLNNIKIPDEVIPLNEQKSSYTYNDEATMVECCTINRWVMDNHIGPVNMIWLDVEGYELPILQNATIILDLVKVLILECNFQEFRLNMTKFEDLYNFLDSHNFELKFIYGRSNWQSIGIWIRK